VLEHAADSSVVGSLKLVINLCRMNSCSADGLFYFLKQVLLWLFLLLLLILLLLLWLFFLSELRSGIRCSS